MHKSQKGFTIIELIVVIAIIAILAAIVMVNVTQYISKAKDASIEGNMGTMATDAAVYFDPTSSSVSDASGLCANSTSGFATAWASAKANVPSSGTSNCTGSSTDETWAASAQLNNKPSTCTSKGWWCVDSTGKSELVCDTDPGAVTACP